MKFLHAITRNSWIPILLVAVVRLTDAAAEPPTGFTEDGIPYMGSPEAPVVLIEYSDYLCPFCARYHSTTRPELLSKYIDSGKLRMEFRHFPLAALHPTAWRGHEAAACAGNQDAGNFWQMHDILFERQRKWSRLPDPVDVLTDMANGLGVDMAEWQQCVKIRLTKKRVESDIAAAQKLKFNGTPSFQVYSSIKSENKHTIVGAQPVAVFADYIDALLSGKEPPKPPEKLKPELPSWAKSEALALDPARPGFTVSGDPTYGSEKARLVVVEFTDYQCEACAQHALMAQPEIDTKLVQSGKIRWVSKQLPLPEHRNAIVAAASATCAGNQGAYYQMHKRLFETQDRWSNLENADAFMIELAGPLPIRGAEFEQCIGSRQPVEHIIRNIYESTASTRVTPSFVILDGELGRQIRGMKKPDKFVELIEEHLKNVLESDKAENANSESGLD